MAIEMIELLSLVFLIVGLVMAVLSALMRRRSAVFRSKRSFCGSDKYHRSELRYSGNSADFGSLRSSGGSCNYTARVFCR